MKQEHASAEMEPAIAAYAVSKSYRTADKGLDRLGLLKLRKGAKIHQALRDVSFKAMPGETWGIVGRNGAGKSTLLKLLTGISEPDTGEVITHGRMLSVIGPMAGMKVDLTGRENLKIRAAVLGMSELELKEKLQEIIEFAQIGEYIDRPMRMYSSGMKARLGFAVNFAFQPDLLVVDETLAGGDNAFRLKVLARVAQIQENGATIILVSHSPNLVVDFCDHALLLERGEKLIEGPPKQVVNAYQRLLNATEQTYAQTVSEICQSASVDEGQIGTQKSGKAHSNNSPNTSQAIPANASHRNLTDIHSPQAKWHSTSGAATLQNVRIDALEAPVCGPDFANFECSVDVQLARPLDSLGADAVIKTIEGIAVAYLRLERSPPSIALVPGNYKLSGIFSNRLQAGLYRLEIHLRGQCDGHPVVLPFVNDALEFTCGGADSAASPGIIDLTEPPASPQGQTRAPSEAIPKKAENTT